MYKYKINKNIKYKNEFLLAQEMVYFDNFKIRDLKIGDQIFDNKAIVIGYLIINSLEKLTIDGVVYYEENSNLEHHNNDNKFDKLYLKEKVNLLNLRSVIIIVIMSLMMILNISSSFMIYSFTITLAMLIINLIINLHQNIKINKANKKLLDEKYINILNSLNNNKTLTEKLLIGSYYEKNSNLKNIETVYGLVNDVESKNDFFLEYSQYSILNISDEILNDWIAKLLYHSSIIYVNYKVNVNSSLVNFVIKDYSNDFIIKNCNYIFFLSKSKNADIVQITDKLIIYKNKKLQIKNSGFWINHYRESTINLNNNNLLVYKNKDENINSLICQIDCNTFVDLINDGPHGLIAGTTGSGKSELVITMLHSLILRYKNSDVNFLFIDFKGGSLSNKFSKSDYVCGIITNLDENVERFFISINQEVIRRQKILSSENVDDVKNLKNKIPRIIIICEEFGQLKNLYPEQFRYLINLFQIGRSLGFNLILITQKPLGIVDDQMWSNTGYKICMRVESHQDSKQVIKTSDSAFLSNPGEGYLLTDKLYYFKAILSNEKVIKKFKLLSVNEKTIYKIVESEPYKRLEYTILKNNTKDCNQINLPKLKPFYNATEFKKNIGITECQNTLNHNELTAQLENTLIVGQNKCFKNYVTCYLISLIINNKIIDFYSDFLILNKTKYFKRLITRKNFENFYQQVMISKTPSIVILQNYQSYDLKLVKYLLESSKIFVVASEFETRKFLGYFDSIYINEVDINNSVYLSEKKFFKLGQFQFKYDDKLLSIYKYEYEKFYVNEYIDVVFKHDKLRLGYAISNLDEIQIEGGIIIIITNRKLVNFFSKLYKDIKLIESNFDYEKGVYIITEINSHIRNIDFEEIDVLISTNLVISRQLTNRFNTINNLNKNKIAINDGYCYEIYGGYNE